MSDINECLYLTRSGLKISQANGSTGSISTDSCYTEEFIDRLNDHHFVGLSDYSNEIFLYHYVRMMEFCELLKSSDCSRCSFFSRFVDMALFLKARVLVGDKVSFVTRMLINFCSFFIFLISVVAVIFLSLALPFYLVRKKEFGSVLEFDAKRQAVFLIRSKAAYQKNRLNIDKAVSALTLVDNFGGLNVPGVSIYSVMSRKNILKIAAKSAFQALRDVKYFLRDGSVMLGADCALALFPDYVKRISHKSVYESCLNEVIRLSPEAVFYTGDKDDRFALLQTRICNREKKQLFCLPHGLEYGFRFPGGLAASTFYCFTPEAASFLNDLYQEKKFVYSESVTDEMYGIRCENQSVEKVERICFFTEPRDPEINHLIINELIGRGVRIFIKLHPLESASDYRIRFPEVEQIDDLEEAMRSTVCIARKSTVLLEASRRGAKAIASLVNDKDRAYVMKIFPSLGSKKILKAFTFNELQALV